MKTAATTERLRALAWHLFSWYGLDKLDEIFKGLPRGCPGCEAEG